MRRGHRPDEPSGNPNNVRSRTSVASSNVGGYRFVLGLYTAPVVVAGVAGYLTGTFVLGLSAPRFPFLVPFPPTPVGFAAYGALTIALVPGVPLAFVAHVSASPNDVA